MPTLGWSPAGEGRGVRRLCIVREFNVQIGGKLTESQEKERLEALHEYAVLDSTPEQGYDDVTELASYICGTPISLVSFVDEDRQWFKSERGFGTKETPRSFSFCANTIADRQTLVVEDATVDPRFRDHPLVTGDARVRFYAGAPIIEKNGHVLGTVCVIDTQPHVLSATQISALEALARQVVSLLDQQLCIARLEAAAVEAKAAERLLQESERRLQKFVDSFPTLAWVADSEGWITWYNRRWYEYTGTTPEEMQGWGWQSVHDPTVLPLVMEKWTKCVRDREPFEMVFPLRGGDGVLRSFMTRVVPIRDESKTVIQWFGTNTEIDALQRTRQALEASETVLKQVMTATSDAVMSFNRDWVLTYLNPRAERLYGSSKDFVGKNVWDAFPDAVYEGSPSVEYYGRAMNEGMEGSFETHYPVPQSMWIQQEVYATPDGVVTFSRDVTEKRLAQAALMQNEKLAAVGRLASSIAHEINNPLEAVTNLLYLLQMDETLGAESKGYVQEAESELRRVSEITTHMLRFYRQSTSPAAVDLGEVLESVLVLFQVRLARAGVTVEKRFETATRLQGLAGELRQVFANLVGNALDATREGGRLVLKLRDSRCVRTGRAGIRVTVADTGSGMSAAVQKKVFEPFFTTKGNTGTGLGLWVSLELIQKHRGTVRLRSCEGEARHGTVFCLFFPG